jgi:hypothetical protein
MVDYLPVMLSVSHPYPELEQWVVERFERLNNKKVLRVTQEMLPEEALLGQPMYAKAWLWDVVPEDTTHILFMDFDMIPLRPLPELPDAPFIAVPDAQWWVDTMKKTFPLFARTQKYFNSGFFVARRDTQPCFEQLKSFVVAQGERSNMVRNHEQTPMNNLIQNTFKVCWLTPIIHCLVHTHYEEAVNACMLHLAGMPNRSRWAAMALFKMLLGTEPIQVKQYEDPTPE